MTDAKVAGLADAVKDIGADTSQIEVVEEDEEQTPPPIAVGSAEEAAKLEELTARLKADGIHATWLAFKESTPYKDCLLYTSPSPRDATLSRMPSSA